MKTFHRIHWSRPSTHNLYLCLAMWSRVFIHTAEFFFSVSLFFPFCVLCCKNIHHLGRDTFNIISLAQWIYNNVWWVNMPDPVDTKTYRSSHPTQPIRHACNRATPVANLRVHNVSNARTVCYPLLAGFHQIHKLMVKMTPLGYAVRSLILHSLCIRIW